MPFAVKTRPSRVPLLGVFSLLLAGVLLVLGIQPLAHAASNVTMTLTPAAVSASTGESLAVTLTIENNGDDVPAGQAIITAPSAVISTLSGLDAWYDSSSELGTGRYLAEVDVPAIAAGKTATVTVELPLASGRFGYAWGTRGLAADYTVSDDSVATARSSFVWTSGSAPAKTAFSTIVAIVPPAEYPGVLSSQDLVELTGPSGVLMRQLQLAQGRAVAIGVDPRIMASIAALGDSVPETVLAWVDSLNALPNESFLLPYANADIAAQVQAGAQTLLTPSTADIIAETAVPSPSATPGPTPAATTGATALSFAADFSALAWPGAGTVINSDLGVFGTNGIRQLILSSSNVESASSTGVVAGMPAVVTSDGLSTAVRHSDVSRGASYLATAALDPDSGNQLFAGLPASFSITGLTKTSQMLDTLAALPWVSSTALSTALGSASTELALVDAGESSQRIAVVNSLLSRNAEVASFSTIAEDPSLITSAASRNLAAVLSLSWLGNDEWNTAVAGNLVQTEKTLNSVSVVTSSTINMVGGQANIPISIHNALLQPVTVVVNADPNNGRLLVKGEAEVTIQPESQAKARIPVQAQVGNGSAILTVSMHSMDGIPVGKPVEIPINVRADWETWGLAAVGIAFVGLITAGVIRTLRRRKQGQSEDV